ncbi:unnamed protein product [Orchesella dallaii]|uniref:Uncharacterized protein n=1 Tax=Orchesella dallaii TaxID=48710 RepID=A0ABP1R3U4_9HEXA
MFMMSTSATYGSEVTSGNSHFGEATAGQDTSSVKGPEESSLERVVKRLPSISSIQKAEEYLKATTFTNKWTG